MAWYNYIQNIMGEGLFSNSRIIYYLNISKYVFHYFALIVLNNPETTLKENLDTYILRTGKNQFCRN